jgi:outer membrane protein insertion porin family
MDNLITILRRFKIFLKLSPLSILPLILLISACNVDKFLEKDQYIVGSNKINIKNVENRRTKVGLQTDLVTLYKQKDLPDILIGKSKFGTWFWYKKAAEKQEPKGFKKWLYNSFASQPAFYNPKFKDATVKNMEQYLKNIGYLYPIVVADHDYKNKDKGFATITYTVTPGILYVIDSLNFISNDTAISYLLNDTREKTLLAKGQPLDLRLFEQEKQRITTALNNFGYARFTSNYIAQLEADTSIVQFNLKKERLVDLSLTVQTPNDQPFHQKYKTGSITVYPNFDARIGEPAQPIDTILPDKKKFSTYDGVIGLKLAPLSNAIPLTEGDWYSKEKTDQTIRQLTNLGVYKFVNIKPDIDKDDPTAIAYKIYLTPSKKMSIDGGVELNYSNINLSSSSNSSRLGRVGIAADLGINHRNLFGGAERLNSRLSFGLDQSLAFKKNEASKGLSYDLRWETTLSIPKFLNISNSWQLFSKIHLIKPEFYKDLKENASSNLTFSYVLSNRLSLDLYLLQQINLGTRYVLKRKGGAEQYVINPTGFELQLAKLTDNFELIADERLKRSLTPQLMTGFLARSMTFERNGKVNPFGERWQLISHAEQSGLEVLLAEQIFNQGKGLKLADTLSFSKFLRGEIDVRYNRQLSTKRLVAARLSMGVAKSLNNAPVPYSRQFYVGGPNSIRGWVIRDIGPGGYFDTATTKKKTFPFQAGDLKLEFNSEFRFPLFWLLNSAVLFDAGNIWNIKKDDKLPNGNIDKFWFDQVAISSGIGLRLDVTYATIRLDFGFKLREPFETNGRNWIPLEDYSWKRNVTPNFALGFPF